MTSLSQPAGSGQSTQNPSTVMSTAPSAASPMPTNARLVQIADDHGTDTAIVRLIATGETELIPSVHVLGC